MIFTGVLGGVPLGEGVARNEVRAQGKTFPSFISFIKNYAPRKNNEKKMYTLPKSIMILLRRCMNLIFWRL